MIYPSTLNFLKALRKNNNKSWFDAHRKDYEAARENFASFIGSVIEKHSKKDISITGLKPKDCMFRINRDLRFSKNKTPYKTNFGAFICFGGKKSIFSGYYFHCEPGQNFTGGGLWMPMLPELNKVRQEIDYNLDKFKKIILSKKFRSVYKGLSHDDEYMLSRIPKGYDAGNPAAEYLKMKSFIAEKELNDAELTSKGLLNKILHAFEVLQPMNEFINESLREPED
ncbi:MAG: DUF2461 domain-containing protein [Chitinophagales bacterium]|nr:DUF2461 domain-containing protein [Chitinophagales bacterium]